MKYKLDIKILCGIVFERYFCCKFFGIYKTGIICKHTELALLLLIVRSEADEIPTLACCGKSM